MITTNKMGNRQVVLDGRGKVTLRQSDHIATGGEGFVYRLSDMAIKIYTNPKKMRQDDMAGKIKLLTTLKHPYIMAPDGLVFDDQNNPIGLYMPYVEGEPFSRVFTNDYRTRSGFGDSDASILVARTQDVVRFAHDNKAIIVDGNELSWLLFAGNDGPEPRIIDVDSWSIGRWPPKVIMPSIHDWHTKDFNEASDWFSWGVVSFQVYTGIHPYKGTLDGYKRGDLERRMRNNASVFMQGVRLNQNVRDFSCIPPKLLDWYIDTFQQGMRVVPPSPFDAGVGSPRRAIVARTIVTAVGALMYKKLYDGVGDPAIGIFSCGVALLKSGILYDLGSKREIGTVKSRDCEVVKQNGHWLVSDWHGNQLVFTAIDDKHFKEKQVSLQLKGYRLLRYENRIFVHMDQGLTELTFKMIGSSPILVPGQTWGVMRHSTRWFDGLGIMDALGATFLILPFGDKAVAQIRVTELDDLKPVVARAGNRFVVIIAVDKNGEYQNIEITLDREYRTYTICERVTDSADLNTAILPRGVCATIVDDGEIDIFVPTSGTVNKAKDKDINTSMILANWDDMVVYIRDGEVWSMRM